MPQDKGNCAPNALLAQIKHLPKGLRAINVRAAMVIELLVHEDTIWVIIIRLHVTFLKIFNSILM